MNGLLHHLTKSTATRARRTLGRIVRGGLAAAALASLIALPTASHAARSINSATLNGTTSITATSGATITTVVNVTTTGTGTNGRWRSTGWSIGTSAPGAVNCIDHANHDSAGSYAETFSIAAPASTGTYNAYFIAYNNDACSSGASTTMTLASAVVVVGASPPTTTTNAATSVTSWTATAKGVISSNGAIATVSFEYGLTNAYGNSIAATPSPLAANATNTAVSADLVGLNCATTFHYRAVASNSIGTTYGTDRTLTTGACTAPYPPTACAATRFGSDLGCTANDVNITGITLAPGSIASCVSGTPVTLDLDLTVNFASPDRWDIGIFIANDGNLPSKLSTNGGAASCSVDILPTTAPFLDLDGVPQGTADSCGDGNSSINGGTGNGVKRMTGVTLPCYASTLSGGKLFVPFVVSWDNQKSPVGSLCTSNLYPVPNTTSKCNAPANSVAIDVVVMPVITKTNGSTEINPGASTTYTVTIANNSGGTLLASTFKDPAVTDPLTPLTVNSVTCAAANGAICPTTTVALMQGSGIAIPSANLPNNSSLAFTVGATLSSGATVGRHLINTATVSIGTHTASATDDDLIVISAAAAMTFSPATITEGAASVLTVTLSNPTGSAVTGVSFTDTYPAGLVNTATANGTTTCGGTVTAANNGGSLSLSGGTIPALGSCTVTVNVTSANAASYFNSTGTVSGSSSISAASATLTVDAAVFGAFNACDVATAPNATCTNTTTVANSHITTKIAGAQFSLAIVALKTDGTRNTSYSNTVLVELLDTSDNSGTLDSYNCRSSWTVISSLSPNPSFSPSNVNSGLITAGPFTVAEAYRNVRVRIRNSGGSFKKGCSTDNFAIRPSTLEIVPTHADWQTTGTTAALTNTDISGGAVHKAGRYFTVTATAMNAASPTVKTAKYAGSPGLTVSACSGTGCTATLGVFALGAGTAFTSGALTSNLATYDEVGALNLTLQDTDFASIDAADTPASCAGYYVCSTATAVGRFVPDHFGVTASSVTNRSDLAAPGGSFSYLDEPMLLNLEIRALNFGEVETKKYEGSFAKLNPSETDWTALGTTDSMGLWMIDEAYAVGSGATAGTCKAVFSMTVPYSTSFVACSPGATAPATINRVAGKRLEALTTTSTPTAPAAPSITWNQGIGTASAHVTLHRADALDGPFTTLKFGIAPHDGDGVTLPTAASTDTTHRVDLDADNNATNERRLVATTQVRFGRLRLINAYGSELLPSRVEVRAEYWNGSRWTTNTLDKATPLAGDNVAVGNKGALVPGTPAITQFSAGTDGGIGFITFPKTGAVGIFDVALDLGSVATKTLSAGSACEGVAWISEPNQTKGANLLYLTSNWCGTFYDKNPVARIKLGSPKAPYIYLRERY